MLTTLRRIGFLGLAGWTMLSSSLVEGRELDEATNLYSRGVHAYFANRASEAESLLSQALEINGQDPRIHYFRALSRLQLGLAGAAREDMAAGARMEAARSNRYAVGTALQRVQGSHRLLLEQYRRDARLKAATVGAEIARQHMEQMTAREAGALREKVIIPLDELLRPGGPQPLSAEEVERRAAAVQQPPAAPIRPAETPTPAAADEDPFRDDAPTPVPEPSPPAASESSPPAETAPTDEDADDNPFDF